MFKDALTRMEELSFSTAVRESSWLFPTIETVHVLALVLVVGSIITVDLRLLGFANRERPFTQFAREMLPWTWTCFVVAAAAGLMMFSSKATVYFSNIPFRIKMACLLLAGINMMVFHVVGMREVIAWDTSVPPRHARVAGGASLLLWTLIVATGRWIGFTT
jgi:hypothetical protein